MTNLPHDVISTALEPGVRAARLRMGLSQDEAADLIGANRSTFKPWDRDERRPRDPEMIQAISEALRTPIEVLWPPANNPHVARSLSALREQRALAAAAAQLTDPPEVPEPTVAEPPVGSEPREDVPPASPPGTGPSVPNPRDILRTLDGAGTGRTRRRFVVPAIVSALVALVAGTAIAAAGSDDAPRPQAATGTKPTAIERGRANQRADLDRARARRDFDTAIAIATNLGDAALVRDLRAAASEVLTRRARSAADRGDLALASARLVKAKQRYGPSPDAAAIQRRISAIGEARAERADKRRRAATRQRAAARARANALAAQRASSASDAPVSPRPTSPSPGTRSPAPTSSSSAPAPATPEPSPSSTGSVGSGSSGTGSTNSGNAAPDPFDF